MELSDGELVTLARAGEAQAMAALLGRHRSAMFAVAVSRLGPGPDVEDVVQDASLVALTSLHRLRDPDSVGAWLTGITRNLCRQRSRGERELQDRGDTAGGADERMERLAVRDWVRAAVDALSEPLRDAVLLRYFSSANSYQSIAAALEVPVGTVRSRLSEARRALSRQLQALENATHDDHLRRERDRIALFTGIAEQYNRGDDLAVLHAALTPGARLRAAGTEEVWIGPESIVGGLAEDVAAGVRLRLLNVVAGRRITVVEGAFVNPPDDPEHCPPLTTQVVRHDGAGIAELYLHYRSV